MCRLESGLPGLVVCKPNGSKKKTGDPPEVRLTGFFLSPLSPLLFPNPYSLLPIPFSLFAHAGLHQPINAIQFFIRKFAIHEDPATVLIHDDALPLRDVNLTLWWNFDV